MSNSHKIKTAGSLISQQAEALATQNQDVAQININEQGIAVAIAVGEDSIARAMQNSVQSNQNSQDTEVTAINVDTTSCYNCFEDANSSVNQNQDVDQINVNFQENAVAIAIDGGDAEATQSSFQNNNNAQITFTLADNENECESSGLSTDAEKGKEKKEMENKKSCSSIIKAQASPEKDTKVIVDIVKGSQKFKVKVLSNGDILVNDRKVDVQLQKIDDNRFISSGNEERHDDE